jgi:homogentisate 1,2-dioxygenase
MGHNKITTNGALDELDYLCGFGNDFATEAMPGVLPVGQNGPQKLAYGLISELVSGTAFTAPRALNRRSYLFRIRPSTLAGEFEQIDHRNFLSPPLAISPPPGPYRWGPSGIPAVPQDFLESLTTICGNGSPASHAGTAIHLYMANRSMDCRAFANTDGEMLILPQTGRLRVVTEAGILSVSPGEVTLIPRGMKFRVDLIDGQSSGFVCENYGLPFILPNLGLIGSHGLANTIDFQVPVAAFEDDDRTFELVQKHVGALWSTQIDHSPFDVVAWRGNWAPVKYDMKRFMAMGTVSVDHPDPSIYCALTSPSSEVAGGNVDFMILPPRWVVAEHSFRPPGYHRNTVSEFLALIAGSNESRSSPFPPGSMSLHNPWTAHGPDVKTFEGARNASLEPQKIEDTLIFMIESRYPMELSKAALEAEYRLPSPASAWGGFKKRFPHSD